MMLRRVMPAALTLLLAAVSVSAATPYKTFIRTRSGDLTETQTAYEPVRTMTKFGEESLKAPGDLRMGPDGNLYICDSGNKRILVVTPQGGFVREIGSGKTLKAPRGVFVARDGRVYVADENARAVVVFDKEGEVVAEYGKPDHPLFGAEAPFKPVKVAADVRGNLYVISTGNTNGVIQISPSAEKGEFLGYFGANRSIVSLLTILRKELFSDAQLARTGNVIPPSVGNLHIDELGMVYTVTQSNDLNALKKLNVAGKNILRPDFYTTYPSAVTTNAAGNIFMTDSNGYILEYTSEGKLLFIFGSYDDGQQRKGLFKAVTGIAVDRNNHLYVLDEKNAAIQVFAPTEFCHTVHDAFRLFMDGRYVESKEPWAEVLRMNSLFSYANVGMGEALYREGEFENALASFRAGGNRAGYSDAFWEVRSDWLHRGMGTILLIAAGAAVALLILRRVARKTGFLAPAVTALGQLGRQRTVSGVLYAKTMLKNPFDANYGIRRENRAGWLPAIILLGLFFALSVLNKYYSGFLFKEVPDGWFNLMGDFTNIFGAFLLVVTCCYLVCTITEGEATFKSLFIGGAFALTPLILAMPLTLALSHVLTFNEAVFIRIIYVVAYGWSGLLMFLSVMYLNGYTIRKTIWTLLLTAFTALVTVALLFVVYVLISQLIDFIASIWGEVVYRFVRA